MDNHPPRPSFFRQLYLRSKQKLKPNANATAIRLKRRQAIVSLFTRLLPRLM